MTDMILDIERVLITEEELRDTIAEIGAQIDRDYEGKNLLLLGVLKGSVVFMADLMRAITVPARIDFMAISSYGRGSTSSGDVRIIKDLDCSVEGLDVLVVEDILDSGNTLKYLLENLRSRNPNSIRLCTLLNKPDRRTVPVEVDYCGFTVPDEFVVGFGLDYNEKYRNLPFVGVLKRQIYEDLPADSK